MTYKNFFLIIFYLLYPLGFCDSQDSAKSDYVYPIDIPIGLSGNFGDIRDNSFHFGIDIRTNEKEGYPVFAVADGYISRIKIEPGGYGNAIYVNHSNGITSVYAHLKSLGKIQDKYAKNEQYKKRTFKIDI
jgi:murein DD-endopeptidase MepM/ murein hydrolase activator NlpD